MHKHLAGVLALPRFQSFGALRKLRLAACKKVKDEFGRPEESAVHDSTAYSAQLSASPKLLTRPPWGLASTQRPRYLRPWLLNGASTTRASKSRELSL